MTASPYLTVPDVAARWHLSARVVREVIAANKLVARKIGGQWLILLEDVETYERSKLNVQPIRPRRRTA